MFIRNAWYFAGFSTEFDSHLVERKLLGEPVVFFRSASETVVALSNRCPHRFAPLSMGRLIDDRIQCAYHGIEFDCTGKCVRIPGQERIPADAAVRKYPLAERWGCVWIWMGDPAHAREEGLVGEFHFFEEQDWVSVHGMKEVAAGYELIIDNLMDLTHIAFLHPNTLGGDASAAEAPVKATVEGDTVAIERIVRNAQPAPLFTRVKKIEGRVDRYQQSRFVPPCFVLIDLKVMPAGTQELDKGIEWRVFHIVTPIDADRTRYHWVVTRHFAQQDREVSRAIQEGTDATLEEDRIMIEAQARMLEGTSLEARTLYTRFDTTPTRVRRIITGLVEREAGTALVV